MTIVEIQVASDGVVHGEFLQNANVFIWIQLTIKNVQVKPLSILSATYISVTVKLLVVGFLPSPSEPKAVLISPCNRKRERFNV